VVALLLLLELAASGETTRFDFAPEMPDCLAESCFFPSVTATPKRYCDSQPLRDELPLLLSISSPKIRTKWKKKFRLGPEEIAMVIDDEMALILGMDLENPYCASHDSDNHWKVPSLSF